MATKKIFTVRKFHNDRSTDYTGTLDELVHGVFGYTLDCGHSWNSRIPLEPKSGKSLVKALNDSAYELRRYNDSYALV